MKLLCLLVCLPFVLLTNFTEAGEQGLAPALALDAGAAIGDVYTFQDPSDNAFTVLIATLHSFLVPGEVPNLAAFDSNVRLRFEIYNDHVNIPSPVLNSSATVAARAAYLARVKPNRTIDLIFSNRLVGAEAQTLSGHPVPTNLRQPLPQAATLVLGDFAGARNRGILTTDDQAGPLTVTPLNAAAANFVIHTISDVTSGHSIQFFAGVTDDPAFADLPAVSAFLDSFRAGAPSSAPFAAVETPSPVTMCWRSPCASPPHCSRVRSDRSWAWISSLCGG